jgi:hypothetical protein
MAHIMIEYGDSGSYQSVIIPVNPEELIFQRQSGSSTSEVINVGEVPLPGKPNLALFTVDTFLPTDLDSPFNSATSDKLHAGDAEFWKGLFNRFLESGEMITVSVIGIREDNVVDTRMPVTVIRFDHGWQGTDKDMRMTVDFREYREITIVTAHYEPAPTPVKKQIQVGSTVICNGYPYKKSNRTGKKGKQKKTTRKVSAIKKGAKCPYYIKTLSKKAVGWMQAKDVKLK